MTVQSARVQKIVKGDDVTLKHQVVKDAALDAEFTRAAVTLASSADKVTFFYQLEDGTMDSIGYPGSPAESYPASRFNVPITGVIAEADPVPARGSQVFKSGQGLTVRAEIIRDFATTPKKETYYLYHEVDVQERGFLDAPATGLILP